jgi:hypothetical protein
MEINNVFPAGEIEILYRLPLNSSFLFRNRQGIDQYLRRSADTFWLWLQPMRFYNARGQSNNEIQNKWVMRDLRFHRCGTKVVFPIWKSHRV